MRFFCLFLMLATAAIAGEYVVFDGGSRMRVDRHEFEGSKVHLYSGGMHIEMDASRVTAFEVEEITPAPPAAVVLGQASDSKPAPTPHELADAAADRYGLPRSLVRSVMAAESGFQSKAISPKGAIGVMQLMPGTAKDLGANPHDPAQNVDAGARYLYNLLLKYDGRLWHALAAYNAGAGAVDRYQGVPPYRETVDYVNRIGKSLKKTLE